MTSIILDSNKIQNGDILVPIYPGCSGKRPLNEVSSPLLLTQLFIMDARSAMRPCYILPILLNGSSRNFHTW